MRKYGPEKTPFFDTFHAVCCYHNLSLCNRKWQFFYYLSDYILKVRKSVLLQRQLWKSCLKSYNQDPYPP